MPRSRSSGRSPAKNNVELLTFLDRLAYGDGSTPGLRDRKRAWDEKLERSAWHRMTGFRPQEPDEPSDP